MQDSELSEVHTTAAQTVFPTAARKSADIVSPKFLPVMVSTGPPEVGDACPVMLVISGARYLKPTSPRIEPALEPMTTTRSSAYERCGPTVHTADESDTHTIGPWTSPKSQCATGGCTLLSLLLPMLTPKTVTNADVAGEIVAGFTAETARES